MYAKGKQKTGGRVKGVKNKVNSKITELIDESGKGGPAKILFDEMHAKGTKKDVKRKIAEILLPYTERRQPQATELSGPDNRPIVIRLNDTDMRI